MSDAFDPYRKWLGIPPAEQPPNHYRLLAIAPFEEDLDVIETAADLRMSHLRTYQTGAHSALSQKLLNEVAAAKLCLFDRTKKADYDAALRRGREAAQRSMPAVPIARPMAPVAVRAFVPTPAAIAEPQIAYDGPRGPAATRGEDGPAEPPAVDVRRMAPAHSKWRVRPEHRGLAVATLGGLAVGFLLAWLVMSGSGTRTPAAVATKGGSREAGGSGENPSGKNRPGGAIQAALGAMLKSIERPSPLGVKAAKLVLWNAHSGPNNDVGTLKCNVQLLAADRVVWSKQAVAVPWAPNEDRSLTLALPPERFDRVRVEITMWEKVAGGLAEIQVFSADGHNVALGCPAIASGAWHGKVGPEHITDGVTTTAEVDVGAWLLPPRIAGWVEVDLSLPRPAELASVTAEKLVIWNQHNGPHKNHGTLECNVRLLSRGRDVWTKPALAVPWSRDEDLSVALELAPTRFDRVRVEITKWQQNSGGLAEIQLLSADGRNLALDCPALANAVADNARSGSRVTDGIVSSEAESVGYWLLPNQLRGWVEVDLACLDAKYGLACRQLGLALALVDGDWQRGLPWLSRGDDRTLRRLALADSQDVFDTPEQLALADAWWELAQQAEGEVRKRLLARSLWRYRQAFHKLREFRKAQIQARFDQALPGLPERDYLYFMPESELKLGWGLLRDVFPISVKGARSPYALFLHAIPNDSPHAAFHLAKRYRRFRGAAAINDSAGFFAGELTFRIGADGRELWKSRPLRGAGSSQPFDLDVGGVDKLELFVDCSGTNGSSAHSVWIEPRLER